MTALEIRSKHQCFGGTQGFYQHDSQTIGLPMRFSVYQPPQALHGPVPILFFLAGLTCTEETFMIKAGAQRLAAEYGLMLVTMDTSPRQTGIIGEEDDWDFGTGAGFYLMPRKRLGQVTTIWRVMSPGNCAILFLRNFLPTMIMLGFLGIPWAVMAH